MEQHLKCMSKETVVEYLGNPKSKSIDSGDIKGNILRNLFAAADTDGELKESFSKIGIDLDALSSLLDSRIWETSGNVYVQLQENRASYLFRRQPSLYYKLKTRPLSQTTCSHKCTNG